MEFPRLVSGTVAQSMASRVVPANHRSVLFEGFKRQSHQVSSVKALWWRLEFSGLKPEEAAMFRKFIEELPAVHEFSFEDPWTGQEYSGCRLANPKILIRCDKSNRVQLQVEVSYAG